MWSHWDKIGAKLAKVKVDILMSNCHHVVTSQEPVQPPIFRCYTLSLLNSLPSVPQLPLVGLLRTFKFRNEKLNFSKFHSCCNFDGNWCQRLQQLGHLGMSDHETLRPFDGTNKPGVTQCIPPETVI